MKYIFYIFLCIFNSPQAWAKSIDIDDIINKASLLKPSTNKAFLLGNNLFLIENDTLYQNEKPIVSLVKMNNLIQHHGESTYLILANMQPIYRHSYWGQYWIYDAIKKRKLQLGLNLQHPEKLRYAKISPTGTHAVYLYENNLYQENINSGEIEQLTYNTNKDILVGHGDWVYEEEFETFDCFQYSPDGKKIAFQEFNTKGVKNFTLMNLTDSNYPIFNSFSYPKVGEKNSIVRLGIINLSDSNPDTVDYIEPQQWQEGDYYIPRFQWIDNSTLIYSIFSRDQLHKQIIKYHNGQQVQIYDEENNQKQGWIKEDSESLSFLDKNGKFLYLTKEHDGFLRIAQVDINKGGFKILPQSILMDIMSIKHVGDLGVYFIGSSQSAIDRYLYFLDFASNTIKQITPAIPGTHSYIFNAEATLALHTLTSSTVSVRTDLVNLPSHTLNKEIIKNEKYETAFSQLFDLKCEFFQLNSNQNDLTYDGFILYDSNRISLDKKNAPLIVFVYGEPAYQSVQNTWGNIKNPINCLLTQVGYVIATFDNRGSPAPKGTQWRKSIYLKLGQLNIEDQAMATELFVHQFNFIDKEKIGIWGWSGGGSSTLNAMFRYPKLFKTGVSVASVPDYKLYDTIYQERYSGVLPQHAKKYENSSAINQAHKLEGKLMIIHGTGDDNVHYQGMEHLINKLIAHNKQFSMMIYPNRNHRINDTPQTKKHLQKTILEYFKNNL